MSEDFIAKKEELLKNRLARLLEDYEGIFKQQDNTRDLDEKNRLQRKLDEIEQQIYQQSSRLELDSGVSDLASEKSFLSDIDDSVKIKDSLSLANSKGEMITKVIKSDSTNGSINPFPGLQPFGIKHKDYFYGRDKDIEALIKPLLEEENKPFVAVIGASGTGKSSLVRVGVILDNRIQKKYEVIRFLPSDSERNPIKALASILYYKFDQEPGVNKIVEFLNEDSSFFTRFCQDFSIKNNKKILLFIDQFEELFTQVDAYNQQKFIDLILKLKGTNEDFKSKFSVLITMRSEFYFYCINSSQLADLFNLGTDRKLSYPGLKETLEMIQNPSEKAGLDVEKVAFKIAVDVLKDNSKIVGEVSENSSLPLMAYILSQLYQKSEDRGDRKLTLQDYRNLGGLQGVINQQAESVFQEFSQTVNGQDAQDIAQDILEKIFFKLISISDLGIITRNKASKEEVCRTPQVSQLVDMLEQARLLIVDIDPSTNHPIIEVAHEALFSSWDRLKIWLSKVREDLEKIKKIVESAHEWKRMGGLESYLWSGDRLIDARHTIERLDSYVLDLKKEVIQPEIRCLEEKLYNRLSNTSDGQIIHLELTEFEKFLIPEVERLEKKLLDIDLNHYERQRIGLKLAYIGDTRSGVGLKYEYPNILWCPVSSGQATLNLDNRKKLKFNISEDFYISKYVVTYKQFQSFLEHQDGYQNEKWWTNLSSRQFIAEKQNYQYDNYPRMNVSWFEAVAFCHWLTAIIPQRELPDVKNKDIWSIRLPTEWEWQLAATEGREREGSSESQPNGKFLCNDKTSKLNVVIAVGMYPHVNSYNGALDFSGNGFEWCLNHGDKNEDEIKICSIEGRQQRTIRSCPWNRNVDLKSRGLGKQPQIRDSKIGFRVVYAPSIPEVNCT